MKKFLATLLASSCIGTLGIAPSVEAHTHHHHHHHHHHHGHDFLDYAAHPSKAMPVKNRKECEKVSLKYLNMSCDEAIAAGLVVITAGDGDGY